MNEYIGKYRVILIITPNKKDQEYIKTIKTLEKYKKKFDLLSTKIKTIIGTKFTIKLFGLDGTLKYKTSKFQNWKFFINLIEEMPMQKNVSQLTLYADYHPKKSIKGFGFRDKDMAINTIKMLRGKDKKYQFLVVNTMYNRAKFHPHRTKNMEEAMKIFKKWLDERK